MRKWIVILSAFIIGITAMPVSAEKGHDMKGHGDGHGDSGDHSGMSMATYQHKAVVDGVRAEFQVMSLAQMKMSDPDGNTHHIMVKFYKEGMDHEIEKVVGKIKVIAPDKQEQTNALKNYGSILAANFTFTGKGKYGVICLFKIDGKKHVAKFWYPHHG